MSVKIVLDIPYVAEAAVF